LTAAITSTIKMHAEETKPITIPHGPTEISKPLPEETLSGNKPIKTTTFLLATLKPPINREKLPQKSKS
jgi:hypothetical protein